MKRPEYIDLKIDLLRKAKKLIKSKNESYICFAIQKAGWEHKNTHADCIGNELSEYVQKSLAGQTFLSGWQRAKGFGDRAGTDRIRQDRLDWIDWMIADYKKWGPE